MMTVPVTRPGMALSELLDGFAPGHKLPGLAIGGITCDSRAVAPGDLFIAQAGLSQHAIDFAAKAVEAGAVAVVYDSSDDYSRQRVDLLGKQFDVAWVGVENLQRKIGPIAGRFHADPSHHMKLVGVTGTDGKTSVTHLLVQALMSLDKSVASIGTLGYGLANHLSMTGYTTPDAVSLQAMLAEFHQAACEYVVMEVSSHALQQYRVAGCRFDVAVLTNLGSDHLDYHGSVEAYAEAKSQLFAHDAVHSRVLNLNDDFGQRLAGRFADDGVYAYASAPVLAPGAGIRLVDQRMGDRGLEMVVSLPDREIAFETGLIGAFNVDNCLACIGALMALGFDAGTIERGMQGLRPIPGRMEYFAATPGLPAVVIDFAHTEQALKACLESLRGYAVGEVYCVFGCGGDRDRAKRPRMAAVAEKLADQVFVTDDNPRTESAQHIMRDILAGFENAPAVRVIHDRETAIRAAMSQASSDDLVVIAGKGHEQYQIVGDQRLVYSDHRVVADIQAEAAP